MARKKSKRRNQKQRNTRRQKGGRKPTRKRRRRRNTPRKQTRRRNSAVRVARVQGNASVACVQLVDGNACQRAVPKDVGIKEIRR